MSKFFNVSSNNQNGSNMNRNGQFQQSQGVITPSQFNNQVNNQVNNQDTESFVVNSYSKDSLNNVNMNNIGMMNPNGGYVNNNQMNMNPNPNMVVQNNNVQPNIIVGNEVLEMPNVNNVNASALPSVQTDEFQNPISENKENFVEEDLPKDLKTNIFAVAGMMIGMIYSPGTTIINNSKKYRNVSKALVVTFWITVLSMVICIASRIIFGAFVRNYNAVTGYSSISFNFANVLNLNNYAEYLIVALVVSFGAIMITSLCYYASSFINSKGVHMGTYFMVSNLAMVPMIIGVLVIQPALSLISSDLGMLGLLFAFLYTVVTFFIGISEVLTFKSVNNKILYNVLNLTVIIMVIYLLFSLLMRLNIITIFEFNF